MTPSVIIATNRSLENQKSLDKTKHALKTLLVLKELDLRCRDNNYHGVDD